MPMRVIEGPPLPPREGNVATMFLASASRCAGQVAYEWRRDGATHALTYREAEAATREVAAGLLSLGVRRGDRVALLADTRMEWPLADFGIQMAGAVTTTLFTTLAADQVGFLLRDSGARVAFVENAAQLAKVREAGPQGVETIVLIDPAPAGDDDVGKRCMPLAQLREQGRAFMAADAGALDARLREAGPDDASTIIYTSGTTGVPKGVVLTHGNCLAAARQPTLAFDLESYDERRTLVFLPLAHSLTRAVFLNAIDLGARIGFASPRTLVEDLRAFRPRLIASAPRIYERIHDQFMHAASEAPPAKRRIIERARAIAIRYGAAVADGKRAPLGLRLQRALYDRLVYSKLREKTGLTHLVLALSGAAAIRPELLHFFRGAGVLIVEAWGLTETSAPGCTNPPDRVRPGTVGRPFAGVSVAVDEDSEILVSGPNVFKGYHQRPGENAEAFVERDGKRWFRTGDIGAFDEAGYLRIVDRKKEIEVLDTGKKIAPVAVEETLKTVSPLVMEACLVGHGRKFAGALVQPNFDRLVAWAKANGVAYDASRVVVRPDPTGAPMTYSVGEDLLQDARVQRLFEGEIAKCNERVAAYERIRAFRLVPNVFSIDRDELTITLKKKRRVILANYKAEVEAMFANAAPDTNGK